MKTIITILLALLSFTCFAFTDCMGPKEVSFWVKFPTHSLTVVSCYACAVFILCLPIRYFQKRMNIKFPLLELFLIFLYGIWLWVDIKYQLTDRFSSSWTIDERFSVFLAYFFFIYRDKLIPFFNKTAMSNNALYLIAAIFAGVLYYSFDHGGFVECNMEFGQVYPISKITAIFVWSFLTWLIFSRSWRILIASLPFTYVFFNLGSPELLVKIFIWRFSDLCMGSAQCAFGALLRSGELSFLIVSTPILILQVLAWSMEERE